jgi:hypothetical protein
VQDPCTTPGIGRGVDQLALIGPEARPPGVGLSE